MHLSAVLQALLVTFLWSTSWVLIKIGLQANLPDLTFAGLRYSLAFLCLLPFALGKPAYRNDLRRLSPSTWGQLFLLGIVYYTLTQGAQFASLAYLPAATLSLLLNFTPLIVALFSGLGSSETPTFIQWTGIALSTVGGLVYFLPLEIPAGQVSGLVIALVCLLANASASILGRQANRYSRLSPILITTISMGLGGVLLLISGILTQGFGALSATQWLIVGWLAVVNTAIAFTLWNHTLRTLTAVESSILNGTMLPQIAILAWLFLGEALSVKQILALALVGAGALIVQLTRK
ncbi:MAG: EamA family transporter [Anaerolineales bacterium]|nr:EamA family transporter [Anaerolineales bacterium]